MEPDATGLVVGGCRLQSILGRGGMGTVYRATQLSLGREVAVKLVPAVDVDPTLVARFQREVRTAAGLEHPHTIPIYAAGEEDGLLYLVMRLVAGPDLGAIIAAEGPLAPPRAVGLIEQVAGALDNAHAAGLVHRDVKPANILVEPRGTGEHAYLSDFGLMRRASGATAITRVGEWVGTVDYVAPEQIEGRPVDLRADIYALTGVLYATLTGRPPFPRANPTDTARAHLHDPPPAIEAGPGAELTPVIARGLAKRPDDRYASAGELAAAARAALGASAVRPRPGGPRGTSAARPQPGRPRHGDATSRPTRRRVTAAVLVIITVSALGGALAALISAHSGSGGHRTTTSLPARPSPAPEHYTGPAESFRYPAGWRIVAAERSESGGAFFRTELVSPDGAMIVIVDRTPQETQTPGAKAAAVQDATARTTPGYEPISFSATTLSGRSAVVWEFNLNQQLRPGRIDIFHNVGGSGYAVYGQADTASAVAPTALAVAESLTAR